MDQVTAREARDEIRIKFNTHIKRSHPYGEHAACPTCLAWRTEVDKADYALMVASGENE